MLKETSFYSLDEKSDNKNDDDDEHKAISWIWPIVVLLCGTLLYYLVLVNDNVLPKAITLDHMKVDPTLFNAENSRVISRRLQKLGPKVVGSDENEIYAPQIIEDEINKIINHTNSNQSILLTLQIGSGSFYLETDRPYINIYDTIQNVIVKVEGDPGDHSLLVNCHYDTVPTSDGAADDAVSCTVMIEIIRLLSISPTRLKHNVVFLFNGAEESGLQAAHMFLSHEWAEKCRMFINLEASGLGGRNILFQSGPKHSWIFEYYARSVPYPHGQVLGEEMFQNGVIPSDSDFRIFRDFGKMPGMDFAFWRNGYIYHTRYDAERFMSLGSHQILGENTLALVKAFGNAPELENVEAHSEGQMVYYDYLGWFMIYYSVTTNIVLNVVSIVLSLASMVAFIGFPWKWSLVGELGISITARILSMLVATGVVVIMALIIDAAAVLTMPWFSNPWLIFPLYWCPCLVFYILIPYTVDYFRSKKHKMSVTKLTQMNLVAAQVPWLLALLVTISIGARSSSVFFLAVLSSAIANLVIHLTPLRRTAYHWIWVYILIHIPSLLFSMYAVVMCYMFFLPIFGRSGTGNYDVYLAIITAFFIFFMINFAIPLFSMVRYAGVTIVLLALFSFIMIIVSLTTSVGHPYKIDSDISPRPQRYWILHTYREFKNELGDIRRNESGYFIYNLDRNGPRTVPVDKESLQTFDDDCANEMLCGLPMYLPRMIPLSPDSHWIGTTDKPVQETDTKLILVDDKPECDITTLSCKLTLSLDGPDRMTLTFVPREGVSLFDWSLAAEMKPNMEWQGRPLYFLHIVRGRYSEPYPLTITFNVTGSQITNEEPILDIALAGNHAHHDHLMTEEFQEFLSDMPEWTQVSPWISAYMFYVF